tara:strand:- start:501 stop:1007 length:507 start_codon:yes stop_codon:yes gene_type:complete
MKKFLILTIVFLISCGPSEEEIQERIDAAVFEATSTTTSTTTTLATEECENWIDGVALINNSIEEILYENAYFDGDIDESLQFYLSKLSELDATERIIATRKARTDDELEILYQLENFRFLTTKFYAVLYQMLYSLEYDSEKTDEIFAEAELLNNQLGIRINNYKCEN